MTREEAIKYLTEEQKKTEEVVALTERDFGVSESVWHTEYEAFNLAIAALREQPRWISVEERLPERGKKVLCYMNYLLSEETKSWGTCVTENTYQGVLVGSNPRKHVWEWQGDFVTHWMPLPKAPEEEI